MSSDPIRADLVQALARVPDVVGEVKGWRAWRLVGTKKVPRLMSVTAVGFGTSHEDAIWPTNRWFRAVCPKGHVEDLPVEGCSCGLYAAKSREQLIRLNYGKYADDDNRVVGEVAFAGKVIPGDQGWRAERARIVSLYVPYEHWEWIDPLARAYRVPVWPAFLFNPAEKRR